jgi:Sulfotransferase family
MTRPLGTEKVFILGAPRSGTTWLQELLGSHPEIVSCQELKLMCLYLVSLWLGWQDQPLGDEGLWRDQRFAGLACVLDEQEFLDAIRGFADACYSKVLELKPGARVVLDKDPPNSLYVESLMKLFPDAKFVHIIRDGREVAASLVNANGSWARNWAPRKVGPAAQVWRRHVEASYKAQQSRHYLEVRHESLMEKPDVVLHEILTFLGLRANEELIEQMNLSAALGDALKRVLVWDGEVKARDYKIGEPAGFRGGTSKKWTQWSKGQAAAFDVTAGDLLVKLGYRGQKDFRTSTTRRLLARCSLRSRELTREYGLSFLSNERMHKLARDSYFSAFRGPGG